MTPPPFRRKPTRADLLRGQVLGIRKAPSTGSPRQLRLTAARRFLLEAIHEGKVRWYPSSGSWRCGGQSRNADVRDLVAAGWAREWIADGRPQIALTGEGEKAIGAGEPR